MRSRKDQRSAPLYTVERRRRLESPVGVAEPAGVAAASGIDAPPASRLRLLIRIMGTRYIIGSARRLCIADWSGALTNPCHSGPTILFGRRAKSTFVRCVMVSRNSMLLGIRANGGCRLNPPLGRSSWTAASSHAPSFRSPEFRVNVRPVPKPLPSHSNVCSCGGS